MKILRLEACTLNMLTESGKKREQHRASDDEVFMDKYPDIK